MLWCGARGKEVRAVSDDDYGLRLFGGFGLRRGAQAVDVPLSAQRLLGFVALNDRPLPRTYVADSLWPDTGEAQAHANLRTALWRLHYKQHRVLDVSPVELSLNPLVQVDTRTVHDCVREYRRTGTLPPAESLLDIHGELLPGCWDSWIVFERERLRHEAIELLEASVQRCLACGDFHLATMLSLSAVECDPLRESANLLNVRARLAAGDFAGAIRYAQRYCQALNEELGLPPPQALIALLSTNLSLPKTCRSQWLASPHQR
jgi:DNA-binding SARP family transcriptional activator